MEDRDTKLIIAKIIDEADSVTRDHRIRFTSFYNPYVMRTIEDVLKKYSDIAYIRYGGYPGAERTILALYPEYMDEPQENSAIQVLNIKWNSQFYTVDHRDILGSLIGFGISRERIGDILIHDSSAYVFTSAELSTFVAASVSRIGSVPVSISTLPCEQVPIPQPKVKIISTTVASPRLDSVVSACFSLSRTKTIPYIENGSVSVNWEVVQKPDFFVTDGDVLSVRGLGRGRVKELGNNTRKNRLFIVLEKFI